LNRLQNPYEALGVADGAGRAEIRQAYRALARRWHPDRFAEGHERMWAERKMVEINLAYHEALVACAGRDGSAPYEITPESQRLEDVRTLIAAGQLNAARQALIRIESRSAEWNYLFGAVLLRLGEYEKAVLYFGIAARQRPANRQYRTAHMSAEMIRNQKNRRRPFSALRPRWREEAR